MITKRTKEGYWLSEQRMKDGRLLLSEGNTPLESMSGIIEMIRGRNQQKQKEECKLKDLI